MIDVSPSQLETIKSILYDNVPDCEVRAFGSRVSWTAREYSDLDLAVVGTSVLDLDAISRLKSAFEESDLPFRVDVLDWHGITQSFQKVIEKKYEIIQKAKNIDSKGGHVSFGQLFAESTRNGLNRPKAVRGAGVKMVNMGELFAHPRIIDAPMDRVPLSEAEAERFLLAEGDLLFARQSLVLEGAGKCSIFLGDSEPVTFESHITRVRLDKKKCDPLFYFYYMQSSHGRSAIRSIVEQGAGASGIRGSDLQTLTVQWRSLEQQRAIARVLGTLDEKIELNRRMSETLEATARALFKSWFVDFDPVRAKAEGRDPGLPKAVADLFPDSFEDSEFGEIPKGWEVRALGDIAEHPRRGIQPEKIKRSTPYIALEHMPKRSILLSEWGVADDLGSNKFEFKRGEILFGKLRPYFHKIGIAPVDGVCSTDIVVVIPREPAWAGLVLGHVSSDAFVEYVNAGATGTKMPRTSWAEMSRYRVAVPQNSICEIFSSQILSFMERIITSAHESRALADLREVLLPKLISGELRLMGGGHPTT